MNSLTHRLVVRVSGLIAHCVGEAGAGVNLSLGLSQRRHQRRLHFAEDLGAETEAVRELREPQRLQVTGQSRHHTQQQLREMLRLDLDVRLLKHSTYAGET